MTNRNVFEGHYINMLGHTAAKQTIIAFALVTLSWGGSHAVGVHAATLTPASLSVRDWMICLRSILLFAMLFCGPTLSAETKLIQSNDTLRGMPVAYLASYSAHDGLILDANNGFFVKGEFRAVGAHAAPLEESDLIRTHFGGLMPVGSSDQHRAHWYVWLERGGTLRFTIDLDHQSTSSETLLRISFGKQTKTLKIGRDGLNAVDFDIAKPGKSRINVLLSGDVSTLKLNALRLGGEAAQGAAVLRARWRPAAVHTQYYSSTCPSTHLWVFETQSVTAASSYSPISTQFGYFGGSFDDDGTARGNLNFSIWAASRKDNQAPPVDRMPCLLATGNRSAILGGFGHEGTGVKIRNWDPIDGQSRSIIQALRVESHDQRDFYWGYFWDSTAEKWVLFAKASVPRKTRRNAITHSGLRASSFCEIPGPPDRERTGDIRRVIRRRGWFLDTNRQWRRG